MVLPYHNYNYIEMLIKSKNSKSFDKELSLRVYNSKNQKTFSDYYVYKDHFNLSIFDQPIWGFCIISDLPVISLEIQNTDEDRKVKLVKGTPGEYPCRYISKIKKYNREIMSYALYLARIFSCLLISLFVIFIFYIITKIKKNFKRPDSPVLIIFFILSIVFIELFVWSHLLYPGVFDYDTFTTYHGHSKHYHFSEWFSYANSFFFLSFMTMWDHIRVFNYVSIIVALMLVGYYLVLLYRIKLLRKVCPLIPIIFLVPSVPVILNFVGRDMGSALLHLTLSFSIPYRYIADKKEHSKSVQVFDILLFVVAFLASNLRREAILTSLVFTILYLFVRNIGRTEKVALLSFFVLLNIFSLFLNHKVDNYGTTNIKMIISLSSSIAVIVRDDYQSSDKSMDRKIIEDYFDYDILVESYSDRWTPINGLQGGIREEAHTKKMSPLYWLVFKLIKDNFSIFIKSKIRRIYFTFSESHPPYDDFYYFSSRQDQHMAEELKVIGNENRFQLIKESSFTKMIKNNINLKPYAVWMRSHSTDHWAYFFKVGPSLIIMIITLLMFKKTPISAMASAVILARLPAMFVLLPDCRFKYVYDFFLFGFFIIPFFIWELKKNFKFKPIDEMNNKETLI